MNVARSLGVIALLLPCLGIGPEAEANQVIHYLFGNQPADRLGFSVAGVGDVNADGYDDIIAGAPYSFGGGNFEAGRAVVYSGKDGAKLHEFVGAFAYVNLGWSVGGVGDLDKDGFDDVIIGIPEVSLGGEGSVEVRSGQTGAVLLAVPGDIFVGDGLGMAVAGGGDIDGDGTPDLLVAAGDPDGLGLGYARVIHGATGMTLSHHAFAGGNTFLSIAPAGDIQGDGVPDFLVGMPSHQSVSALSSLGGPLYVLTGPEEYGRSVAGAGDLNADGFDDFYVGAPGADVEGIDAGRVYAVSGQTGGNLFVLDGEGGGDQLGASVARVADIDADGTPDLMAGMPGSDCNGNNSGSVRTYSAATAFLLYEQFGTEDDELGWSLASAGDVNGDSKVDAIAGAPPTTVFVGLEGSVWVFTVVNPNLEHYGQGCPGTGGFVPELHLTGSSDPGDRLKLSILKGLGGSVAYLLLGFSKADVPIGGGCSLLVGPPIQPVGPFPLSSGGPGDGDFYYCVQIPSDQISGTVMMQGIVGDQGTALGFSMTNGCRLTIP